MTPKKKAKLSSPFKPHEWQEVYGIYENGFGELPPPEGRRLLA